MNKPIRHSLTGILTIAIIFFNTHLFAGKPSGATAKYGESRNWKDSEGTFSVEAKLVDAGSQKVRLERSNGSVVSVDLDKLSKNDQAFVREFLEAEKSEATKLEKRQTFKPIKVANFTKAKSTPVEVSVHREFYKGAEVTPMKFKTALDMSVEIKLPDGHGCQLVVAGAKPIVYTNIFQQVTRFSNDPAFSALGCIRLPDGEPTLIADSRTPWKLISVTPDGKRFIVTSANDFAVESLAIWDASADEVNALFQFPLDGLLNSAAFITNDLLVTLTNNQNILVWNLKNKKAFLGASIPGAMDLKVGGRGEQVAVSLPGKIVLLDGAFKNQLGLINFDTDATPTTAFSPSGKYLATYTPLMVNVYRLSDGELHASIPVPFISPRMSLEWSGEYCMVGHQLLLDIEAKAPLWRYIADDPNPDFGRFNSTSTSESRVTKNGRKEVNFSSGTVERYAAERQTVWAGQLFSLFKYKGSSIVATVIPHDEAIAARSTSVTSEEMNAIPNGTDFKVELKSTGLTSDTLSGIESDIESHVSRMGWRVDSNSSNLIRAQIEALPKQKIYQQKREYTPLKYTLTIQVAGETILSTSGTQHYGGVYQKNETDEEFEARTTAPRSTFFINNIPSKILWPKYQWGLGTSIIEPSGSVHSPEGPAATPERRKRPRE